MNPLIRPSPSSTTAHPSASGRSRSGISARQADPQAQAMALVDQGHYEAALDVWQRLALESPTADLFVAEAVCLIHLDGLQLAIHACDRALALQADHPQAWLFRGVALQRLGQFREAYRCYDRATGRPTPRSPLSRVGSWLRQGQATLHDCLQQGPDRRRRR